LILKIEIEIEMDNAAFEGAANAAFEVVRILDTIKRDIVEADSAGAAVGNLRDINGNKCGKVSLLLPEYTSE